MEIKLVVKIEFKSEEEFNKSMDDYSYKYWEGKKPKLTTYVEECLQSNLLYDGFDCTIECSEINEIKRCQICGKTAKITSPCDYGGWVEIVFYIKNDQSNAQYPDEDTIIQLKGEPAPPGYKEMLNGQVSDRGILLPGGRVLYLEFDSGEVTHNIRELPGGGNWRKPMDSSKRDYKIKDMGK